jgi:hypothetical protein
LLCYERLVANTPAAVDCRDEKVIVNKETQHTTQNVCMIEIPAINRCCFKGTCSLHDNAYHSRASGTSLAQSPKVVPSSGSIDLRAIAAVSSVEVHVVIDSSRVEAYGRENS